LQSSSLSSQNDSSGQAGGNIALRATGALTLSDATLGSELISGSAGGTLDVCASTLTMSGGALRATSSFSATGRVGDIKVHVGTADLSGNASILSSSGESGDSGNISLHVDHAARIGGASSIANASDAFAGQIAITASSLELVEGAVIVVGSLGGKGGGLEVTSQSVLISNAGISSQALFADVGPIHITAPTMILDNGFVSSSTINSGRAGDVRRDVSRLTLVNGAQIASEGLAGRGAAGNILVPNAASVEISGSSPSGISPILDPFGLDSGRSGIFSTTKRAGLGGDITIVTGNLTLKDGGQISADSASMNSRTAGRAGNITITFADTLRMDHGSIATSSAVASGGNIIIQSTGSSLQLFNSQITTSVHSGDGSGGTITLGSPVHPIGSMALLDTDVLANAFRGPGGHIGVFADVFLQDGGQLSAFSAESTPGTINVQARVTDVSGSLAQLPGDLLQAQNLLRAACAARTAEGKTSSLIVAGREGAPPAPGGVLSSPLEAVFTDDQRTSTGSYEKDSLTASASLWSGSNCAR
jgi:hypothetical protein